jgi:hypothetical protein
MGIEPTTTGTKILRFVPRNQRLGAFGFLPLGGENGGLGA